MTNLEHYKKEICNFAENNIDFALRKGKLVKCKDIQCNGCDLNYKKGVTCITTKIQWFFEEYYEPPYKGEK